MIMNEIRATMPRIRWFLREHFLNEINPQMNPMQAPGNEPMRTVLVGSIFRVRVKGQKGNQGAGGGDPKL